MDLIDRAIINRLQDGFPICQRPDAEVATELGQVGLTRVGAVLNKFDARGDAGYRSTAAVRHGLIG